MQLVQLVVLVSMLPTVPGMIVLVDYSVGEMRPMVATALPALDWFSGRPACPRRPHCPRCPTQNTHTHNHAIAATAAPLGGGRRGWDAGERLSRGRLAAASEMRPAGSGFDRVLAGLTDLTVTVTVLLVHNTTNSKA